jgi:VWFA-related protein
MSRQAGRRGIAVALGLILLSGIGTALAQEDADEGAILNAVDAQQVPGQAAFDVTAYVTVLDANHQPITDLTSENFSLSEDGSPVELLEVSQATQGANIVLVLDTSGSMAFLGKMDAVKGAAATFVRNLSEEDRIAIVAFNDTDEILTQEFSEDQVAAASIVDLIVAEPDSGTCLYDAAYDAGILATTAPPGRRAIILLTDGVDEKAGAPGVPCSTHNAQEVIDLASSPTTRSPVYTIGVGGKVDPAELRQIASDTGGTTVTAASADEVSDLFDMINLQLKSQYALSYRSTATGNDQHSLTVTVTQNGTTSVSQRNFVLDEPILLTVTGLTQGDSLSQDDSVTAQVSISGTAETTKVTFSLDGGPEDEFTAAPFRYSLDAADLESGSHTLTVEVELADGTSLADTIGFSIAAPPVEIPEGDTGGTSTGDTTVEPQTFLGSLTNNLIPLGIGAVVVVGLVAFVLIRTRQRPAGKVIGGTSGYAGAEDMTRDIYISQPLATLTVRESLNLHPGQPFDVSEPVVRLGRGADNDIVVPDEPVSRKHAEIRMEDNEFRVFDLGSKYGTQVSGAKVEEDGLPLRDGDELALGTRTRLSFTVLFIPEPATEPILESEDVTMDITLDDTQASISGDETAQAMSDDDDTVPPGKPIMDRTVPDQPIVGDDGTQPLGASPDDPTTTPLDDTQPSRDTQDDAEHTIPLNGND